MLEKKTTKQIIQESESYLDFPILDDKLIIGQDLPLRVWVSQESINNLIEMFRQEEITQLKLLIELKGEK